jgi:hypothetical protein
MVGCVEGADLVVGLGGRMLTHRLLATGVTLLAFVSFCTGLSSATVGPTANARVSSNAISVRGHPFFPVMLIDQCAPDDAARARALGINLIVNEHCAVPPGSQLARIQQHSLAVLSIASRDVRGRGLVGWTFPDEPENNGWTPDNLRRAHPYQRGSADGLLSFVTTGGGFFRAPYRDVSYPRALYRDFAHLADVAGFDLYPLGHCHSNLKAVYDAQRQFVALAGAMPTFQWIETGPIRPGYCGGFQMTPAELRAETWLSIVGGARGVGYFTHTWAPDHREFDVSPQLQATIARISQRIAMVRPGLLGTTIGSDSNSGAIKVLARTSGDRIYVFAVNGNPGGLSAKLHIPALRDGPLNVLGEDRTVMVRDHRFDERFRALGVHVYVQQLG